jgi:hypothetical protein
MSEEEKDMVVRLLLKLKQSEIDRVAVVAKNLKSTVGLVIRKMVLTCLETYEACS